MSQVRADNTPEFRGGPNIALKLPPSAFKATLAFYRDVLRLPVLTQHQPNHAFQFGSNTLWLDRVAGVSQAELWLQIIASDVAAAKEYFATHGVVRCDEIEPLPEGFDGFWILSPSSTVHNVCSPDEV